MTIVLVGGGSGGHLTPLIAVGDAIKHRNKAIRVVHIGQKGEHLQDVVRHPGIDESLEISAGKFRRYHGESFLSHILDIKTLLLNTRDFFRFLMGTVQAWRVLGKLQPDAVFLKGGFVSVPVGYAARLRKIPYVTHDSDAIPGLANRMMAAHAVYNTTAMPSELYPYDSQKTRQVGIPIQPEFKLVTDADRAKAKQKLDLPPNARVLVSVGGGLGAQTLNQALASSANQLLSEHKNLYVIHLTGKKLFDETKREYEQVVDEQLLKRVRLIDFSTELYDLTAAADVVLARAGATNIAELAAQGKACVIVPNPILTGGQQLHNAKVLEQYEAAVVLAEAELDQLVPTITHVLTDEKLQASLRKNIQQLSHEDAAETLATMLIELHK